MIYLPFSKQISDVSNTASPDLYERDPLIDHVPTSPLYINHKLKWLIPFGYFLESKVNPAHQTEAKHVKLPTG